MRGTVRGGGSRFLYEPFDAAAARIEVSERIQEERWALLERRLNQIEVALDQCWDLLRQRRARRSSGLSPDDAQVRSEGTVEGYEQ